MNLYSGFTKWRDASQFNKRKLTGLRLMKMVHNNVKQTSCCCLVYFSQISAFTNPSLQSLLRVTHIERNQRIPPSCPSSIYCIESCHPVPVQSLFPAELFTRLRWRTWPSFHLYTQATCILITHTALNTADDMVLAKSHIHYHEKGCNVRMTQTCIKLC